MRVTEIFHSIQGESSFTGRPCVFVRLTGCPLRCTWCDSEYTFHGGTEMALDDVLAQVHSYDCRLVEVTGGEPLHQPEAFTLIERLCTDGYEVLVETSGSLDIAPVDPRARRLQGGRHNAGGRQTKAPHQQTMWGFHSIRTAGFLDARRRAAAAPRRLPSQQHASGP